KEKIMRATLLYRAGDVRVQCVPDPAIFEPTDAIIRVVRSCICGSDVWPYNDMPASERAKHGPLGDRAGD
ncbi:MAG: hypothetical protein WD627_00225, partial [Actinomycetota bacterium]